MYSRQYAEALEDSQDDARERERSAIDHSIFLMERAEDEGASQGSRAKAIFFTGQLWAVLVEDLADPGNALPKDLRAQIISIGIWIIKELERLRNGDVESFADIVAVSKSIRDGIS